LISGVVDKNGVPRIPVQVAGKVHGAVIDTGFNGDLELPEVLRQHVNPRWTFQAISHLAAGVTVLEDVYTVDFTFYGKLVEAEATFVEGDDILIGTRLLRGYSLRIAFGPVGYTSSYGRVQIRELPERSA
jgi:predicted aspartyl protease